MKTFNHLFSDQENKDAFATNFCSYEAIDKIYVCVQESIRQLENLRGTLHQDKVKNHNELAIDKARELLRVVWILRRNFDQHAG